MTDSAATMATMFSHLTKLFKSLVPDQVTELVSGAAKLVVLMPGQRVIDPLPGLEPALRLLRQLTLEEAAQVAAGHTKMVLLPAGHKIVRPLDLTEVAADLRKLQTADELVLRLDADTRLTGPQLKKLAAELNIVIPPKARVKSAIQLHIAQTLAAYRGRNPEPGLAGDNAAP